MLIFKPIEDKNLLKLIIGADSGFIGYIAEQDNRVIGKCLLELEMPNVLLQVLEFPPGEISVAEGLIRASLHYAANRNFYMARIKPFEGGDFVLKMGFTMKNGIFEAEIYDILINYCHGCCQTQN